MDCVFLNGTVGVGKTTAADAIGALERGPHAVIDLDQIRRLRPAPGDDSYAHEIELRNLTDLARNYREAGARRLILAGVLEQRSEVERYVDAVRGDGMLVCRLVADPAVIARRLRLRHRDDAVGLDWHLRRAGELDAILQALDIDDLVVDTTGITPEQTARQVRAAARWE